jgi:hypothetical protein
MSLKLYQPMSQKRSSSQVCGLSLVTQPHPLQFIDSMHQSLIMTMFIEFSPSTWYNYCAKISWFNPHNSNSPLRQVPLIASHFIDVGTESWSGEVTCSRKHNWWVQRQYETQGSLASGPPSLLCLMVLGIKTGASDMLGKCSTPELYPKPSP